MTLEMAWRTRPLQLALSGGPVTPTPIREYNGLRGENRGPFKGQQAAASNPVMYWPFVRGIHRSPVSSPHKGQRRGALIFPLICARTNDWINTRDAGGLRRHHAYYNVTVMAPEKQTRHVHSHPLLNMTRITIPFFDLSIEGHSHAEKISSPWRHHEISTFPSTPVYPDSEVHMANMGPTWVLSAPDEPHVGHMNLAIRVVIGSHLT